MGSSVEEHDAQWAALMAAAQGGDQVAYRRLLQDVLPLARRVVRRRISDPVLVEDVVQDTLLAVHRVRHTYDPRRPFTPWLAAIAHARAIDAVRVRSRLACREVSDPAAVETFPDVATREPGAMTAAREIEHRLTLLPRRQKEAVELVKLQDRSLGEAAELSNQSVPTLKSLLHRAMITLRANKDAVHE